MASKKGGKASSTGGLAALKIGSRVRCTEDAVEGRIVWANAVSVKIRWNDGEQVTWRRDSLASRPIEILEPAGEEEQVGVSPEPVDGEQATAPELPREEPPAEAAATEEAMAEPEQPALEAVPPSVEAAAEEPAPSAPEMAEEHPAPAAPEVAATTPAPSKRRRKAPAAPKEKKLSAIDAAARVLAEAGQAMTCQEMIVAMAAKGYSASPGGKTPAATLYSAILREIATKGTSSRFEKTERGKFALANAV